MNDLPLRDIHLPGDNLWWPPAPGWWILLIMTILISVALPRFLRWLRRKPIKSVSLREFQRIRQSCLNEQMDKHQVINAVSVLLRRTVISYGARETDASLSGDQWVARLNQISGSPCFSAEQYDLLISGQYQPKLVVDIDGLLSSCESWIHSLPKRKRDAAN